MFLLTLALIAGQAKAPSSAPSLVPSQFPTLASPANLGVRVGETTTITLAGANLADATELFISHPGATSMITAKAADTVTASVTVPTTAVVGLYQIRIVTAHGVSNFRPLAFDDMPSVAAKTGIDKKEIAQSLTLPCVVRGTATADVSDFYKIHVEKGQRLTIEALGRRLGSPIDPVLILHEATGNRELPGLYADDTLGLQTDARLTHTFPTAADIVIEIRDTTFRGGAEYVYRLRIGDSPAAMTAFPLAVQRGRRTSLGFSGPGMESVPAVSVRANDEAAILTAPKRAAGLSGWGVPVRVSEFPESVEVEPNDTAATATPLPVPGGISARFATKGDVDHFRVVGRKGQKLVFTAEAVALNSPTEVFLRVNDGAGKQLAASDPMTPTANVEVTPVEDGPLDVVAEQLNYLHGPSEVYHLVVRPASAGFEVALGADRCDLPGLLPITGVTKLNGFAGVIELKVTGRAGIAGTLTIPPGATFPLYLPVTAADDVKAGAHPLTITATAIIDGKPVAKHATVGEAVKAVFGPLANSPPEMMTGIVAVQPAAPPFTMSFALNTAEVSRGGVLKGTASVVRAEDFDAEIALSILPVPGVTVKLTPIPKGATEVAVEFTVDTKAASGVIVLSGTAKAGAVETVRTAVAAFVVAEPKKK